MSKRKRIPKGPQQGPAPAIFSFGGGVQSTACLILAAQGVLPYRYFVFANVGDDSEHPDTLEYINRVSRPYAERHGLHLVELRLTRRGGKVETLREKILRTPRSIDIPFYVASGSLAGKRQCTHDFKAGIIQKWLRQLGATAQTPAHVGIGISLDEWERMKPARVDYQVNEYPLIDLKMDRTACENLILKELKEIAPESSCFYCPYHDDEAWEELLDNRPDLFEEACSMEDLINGNRRALGLYPIFLTEYGKPLREVFKGQHREQTKMFTRDRKTGRFSCSPFGCTGAKPAKAGEDPLAGLVARRLA